MSRFHAFTCSSRLGPETKLAGILLACCSLTAPAASQVGTVTSLGPFGGNANAVLVDPLDDSVVFAATFEDGLLRSTDGGVTFAPFGAGLTGVTTDLQADPATPTRYFALSDANVFRSDDAGANWSQLALTLPSTARNLAIAGDVLLVNDVGTLWRSDDAGGTWTQVYTNTVLQDVEFAPTDPNVAYLGRIGGVDRSDDGGLTWTPTAGLTEWTQALAVDPTDEDVIYAAGALGVFEKSTDGGATSFSITTGWSTSSTQFLEFLPGSSTALWGAALDGMYRTVDGGSTWQAVNQGLGVFPPIPSQLGFRDNGDLLLATEDGFFTLGGGTPPWVQTGFATVDVNDVAFAEPGGRRLAASEQGIYRANPGQQLVPSRFFFDFGASTNVVLADPDDSDRWISGGVGSFIDNAQVRVLQGDGQFVQVAYEVFGAGSVQTLVMSPDDPDLILGGVFPNAFGAPGILRSTDRGGSFAQIAGTESWPIVSIDIDPFDTQNAVAYFFDHAWASSTDGGLTWSEQVSSPWAGTGTPVHFAYDRFDSDVWYRVTTGEGLWRSEDSGATWAALGVTANDASDLEPHPDLAGHFWYSDGSGQVLYTTDRGDSFELVLGLSADAGPLALDASTLELLVGTAGASAFEIDGATPFRGLGGAALTSSGDAPTHTTGGGLPLVANASFALAGSYTPSDRIGVLAISTVDPNLPLLGGVLHVLGPYADLLSVLGGDDFEVSAPIPADAGLAGQTFFSQYAVLDGGIVLSDAVATTVLP